MLVQNRNQNSPHTNPKRKTKKGQNRPRQRKKAQPPPRSPLTRTARLASRHLAAARLSDHITRFIVHLVRGGGIAPTKIAEDLRQCLCITLSKVLVVQPLPLPAPLHCSEMVAASKTGHGRHPAAAGSTRLLSPLLVWYRGGREATGCTTNRRASTVP
jgi:hypothetical protein